MGPGWAGGALSGDFAVTALSCAGPYMGEQGWGLFIHPLARRPLFLAAFQINMALEPSLALHMRCHPNC